MSQTANMTAIGPRVGWWLRSYYAGSRAKNVAREFEVSEATAKRWLAGALPTSEHLAVMAKRYGWRFVSFIYEPAVGAAAELELEALREEIARTQERIADVAARLDHVTVAPLASAGAEPTRAVSEHQGKGASGEGDGVAGERDW